MAPSEVQASAQPFQLLAPLRREGPGHPDRAGDLYVALGADQGGQKRLMVVKQLRSDLAEDPDFLALFLDEARLTTRLRHPNIVQTFDVGVCQGHYFVALEYLEGQSLAKVLTRMGVGDAVTLPQHMRLFIEVLAGLHYAHSLHDDDGTPLGVVHSNVTPRGIFVTYEGGVKLLDFGLAKITPVQVETRHDLLKGKLAYLSPERARGERVDGRADLFSVGVMLWQATTGQPLWKGMTDVMVLTRLSAGHIPSVLSVCPMTPPQLAAVCDRALAPWVDDRYTTAAEMAHDLEQCLEELGERGSLREIGGAIAQLFAIERGEVRSRLAGYLAEHGQSWPEPPSPPSRRSAHRWMARPETTERSQSFIAPISPEAFGAPSPRPAKQRRTIDWSTIPLRALWASLVVALAASIFVLTMLWHTLRRLSVPGARPTPSASAPVRR